MKQEVGEGLSCICPHGTRCHRFNAASGIDRIQIIHYIHSDVWNSGTLVDVRRILEAAHRMETSSPRIDKRTGDQGDRRRKNSNVQLVVVDS